VPRLEERGSDLHPGHPDVRLGSTNDAIPLSSYSSPILSLLSPPAEINSHTTTVHPSNRRYTMASKLEDKPTRTIRLFCWIVDISQESFSISIEESQYVEDMKQAILDKNRHLFPKVINDPGCLIAQRVCVLSPLWSILSYHSSARHPSRIMGT
jgi:hypothetical protein